MGVAFAFAVFFYSVFILPSHDTMQLGITSTAAETGALHSLLVE